MLRTIKQLKDLVAVPRGSSIRDMLARHGVAFVPKLLNPAQVFICHRLVTNFSDKAIQYMEFQAGEGDGDAELAFSDAMSRESMRMDLRPPELLSETHLLSPIQDLAASAVGSNFTRYDGALVALPAHWSGNCEDQEWHRDGFIPGGTDVAAVVSYIPLVDLDEENGVTEFLVGAHTPPETDRPHRLALRWEEEQLPIATTAGMRAGDAVVFHINIPHRGLNNESSSIRPVLSSCFAAAGYDAMCQPFFGAGRHCWGDTPMPTTW